MNATAASLQPPPQPIADDLRGIGRLAVDGVTGVATLVESVHAAVLHAPAWIGRPAPRRTRGLSRVVYRSVRGVARLVGQGVDRSLAGIAPLLGEAPPSPRREALRAAINGVLGDHLEASGNPLAIRMQLRRAGAPLPLTRRALAKALPDASGKLVVQVHGLCMNDLQWAVAGHDHGAALEREHGRTAVQLHYNTGRPLADNGREFARLLQRLVQAWPVPVQELTLLCHSMGGLVTRNALHEGTRRGHAWAKLPIRAIFLGTPHHGAPLARAGRWVERLVGASPYGAPFARVAGARSAGMHDLRHGGVDAEGRPLRLPASVQAYAIASITLPSADDDDIHKVLGDGLVPVDSALGRHPDPALDLGIPRHRRWVARGVNHFDLLSDAAVYARIARWMRR